MYMDHSDMCVSLRDAHVQDILSRKLLTQEQLFDVLGWVHSDESDLDWLTWCLSLPLLYWRGKPRVPAAAVRRYLRSIGRQV